MGSDCHRYANITYGVKFQSTLPRGERLPLSSQLMLAAVISIHAPAWGATQGRHHAHYILLISIHAPAWGATSVSPTILRGNVISIHAPAWERLLLQALRASKRFNFNPRSRVGSDGNHAAPLNSVKYISIHAPAWGATGSKGGSSGKADISIHAPAWGATITS